MPSEYPLAFNEVNKTGIPSKSRILDLYFNKYSFHLRFAVPVSDMPNLWSAASPGMPRANFNSSSGISFCSISATVSFRLCRMADSVSSRVPSMSNMIDYTVPADSDSRQNNYTSSNPYAILYLHRQGISTANLLPLRPVLYHTFVQAYRMSCRIYLYI